MLGHAIPTIRWPSKAAIFGRPWLLDVKPPWRGESVALRQVRGSMAAKCAGYEIPTVAPRPVGWLSPCLAG